MKKTGIVITVVSLFALFYQLSPYIGVPDRLVIAMFLMAPVLVLYMVYVILKYGKPSGRTFDEHFYDDVD
jgi:hypothetical protein